MAEVSNSYKNDSKNIRHYQDKMLFLELLRVFVVKYVLNIKIQMHLSLAKQFMHCSKPVTILSKHAPKHRLTKSICKRRQAEALAI